MKIIIFSDSHKNFDVMMHTIEREQPVDHIIHAGDVYRDAEDLEAMYPQLPIAAVTGNNDFLVHGVPSERFFTLQGIKIFLAHGHNYSVKYSCAGILKKAAELGADIAIFGHTHKSMHEKVGNITLFNPGAASRSYGVLEIKNGKYTIEIKES